jgi:integrase
MLWRKPDGYEEKPLIALTIRAKFNICGYELPEVELLPFFGISLILLTVYALMLQVAALRRSWIDTGARTISFPAEIMKGNKPHTIPYSDLTASILESVPDTGDLLFPARGSTDRRGFTSNSAANESRLTLI